MNEIIDWILALDVNIRFVGIVNNTENTLCSKMNYGKISLITPQEEEGFAIDLQTIKKIHDKFDDKLGKVICNHIVREKLHQLIFFVDNCEIYVTFEPHITSKKVFELTKKIESLLLKVV